MDLRRWTPLTFLTPRRYVDEDPFWAEFDLEAWAANRYEWNQDPWNGLLDFAKRPRDTVRAEEGDCEDFALVLLVENAVALYFFFSMAMFYAADPAVQQAVLVLRALQFLALVVLTYVTWQ